ncbi:MAG: 16S rRNA (guanine(527)-N(7))-methyltransferase RsmG [Calditrichaeota bacterium]|nr:16S rRNA (guanine(527)-N(7))-methyltransferase RsmG [Calditrichota bacterium]
MHQRRNSGSVEQPDERQRVQALFPEFTLQQWQQLDAFVDRLREWNQRVNLVSRRDVDHLWEHHILPSLLPLKMVNIPVGSRCLDMGSGGGFPAIPLKIARPDLEFLLVESVRKKSLFLRMIIQELSLECIAVMNQRVESLHSLEAFQEAFDWVTARAVADLATLLEWGHPLLRKGGTFLFWKGEADEPELKIVAERWQFPYQVICPESRFADWKSLEGLRFFLLEKTASPVVPRGRKG